MFKLPLSSGPRLRVLATAIAAGLLTQSLSAGTIPLVITENSASDFTATYNGSPLSPTFEGNDQALFSLPGVQLFNDISGVNGGSHFADVGFSEPDDPALFNSIVAGHDQNDAPSVFIHSDLPIAPFQQFGVPLTLFPDGSSIIIGFDNLINQNTIVLTFHDNAGNTESVPDKGSTLALLALALAGLFGASGLRSLRAA